MDDPRDDAEEVAELLASLLDRLVTERSAAVQRSVTTPRAAGTLRLNASQDTVMRALAAHGGMRVGELAGWLPAAQSTLSEIVAHLERSRLVRRESDPSDSRAVLVTLTVRGARVMAERAVPAREACRLLYERLGPRDRARLRAAVETLLLLIPGGTDPNGDGGHPDENHDSRAVRRLRPAAGPGGGPGRPPG